MDTKRLCLFGSFLVLFAGVAHAARFEPSYETHFDRSDQLDRWIQNSGSWSISSGKFADREMGATDIATVEHYDPDNFSWPTMFQDYGIDLYGRVQDAGDSSVGVVYDFQDLANYHEASLSATGIATLRSVIGGVAQTEATGRFPAPGIGKWFHIVVFHAGGATRLTVDGRVVLMAFQQGLPQGDVGVVTHNTRGQFDDFLAHDFSQVEPYTEDFNDTLANSWGPLFGSWSVLRTGATTSDLSYVSTAVNQTSIATGPIPQIWDFTSTMDPFPQSFTFKSRMMNPYGGSGNLIGIAWVDFFSVPRSYVEVVFSPRGQARIDVVENGVSTVLAEAPYQGGGPNKWFDVEVVFNSNLDGEGGNVKVNGVTVFDTLPRSDLRDAEVGLVTHWAPGRFDDVRAAWSVFGGLAATMDDGRFPGELLNRLWTVQEGTLKNGAVTATDQLRLDIGHEIDDIEFRSRIVNHYANAGNLVGLAYGYRAGDDYFEATFSPTGVAKLNRVLKGVTTNVATTSYSGGGQDRWFDVQLIQRQLRTTVKVNGVTVFNKVPQLDAGGGSLALLAHWTKANFDDIFVTQVPPAP